MGFSHPLYLLLLLPSLVVLFLLSSGMHGMTRLRKRIAIALRAVILLLLVLALAGFQTVRPNKGVTTLFVLDLSASMSAQALEVAQNFIRRSLQALGPDDRAGLVVFGKEPVIDVNVGSLRSLGKIYAHPDPTASDIAAAIRLASATFEEGTAKRIVLLSDGNETTGDAAQAAEVAATDGIQIDVVRLAEAEKHTREVVLREMSLPGEVSRGEPFEVRLIADTTVPAEGVLRLDRDGVPVARLPVRLSKGTNSLVISQPAEQKPGFYRYRAVLEVAPGNDRDARNNVGMGFVSVRGRPRVLVLEGSPGSATALERALKVYDLDVVRAGVEGLPTRAEDLQEFDAVFLSDFPAQNFTDRQMHLIASAVRESGIGFGMIGGEHSFLPGGYYGTPIADVLPVDLNVRQRKVFPSTTILIVIDSSGSMGMIEDGVPKIKIAATAAGATVRMMSPSDFVGVAGSTDQIDFVAPIQQATNKEAITAQVGRLSVGGGGIYIRPSLEFAYKYLSKQNTRVRHLILLADGNDSEEQGGALELARKMVAQRMTISVVSIGNGKDVPFLKALAATGKGHFYLATQAKQLQRLFTRDASMMSRSAIEEGTFLPKVDPGDEALRGLDLRAMPPLHAYCLTSDRPLARIPMRTAKDDPLLAFWQYGLGTAMAFTSDAQPRWARPWMSWRDFNAFWAQVARSTLRRTSGNRLQITTRREGGKGVVEVEAYDPAGNPINHLAARASVLAPDGRAQEVTLRQQGPGRYQGEYDAGATGGYIVSVVEGTQTGTPRITRAGFSLAYPPEYQAVRANDALLTQIAQLTGGQMLENPLQSFRPSTRPGQSIRDLWPNLLFLAMLLFPLDIAVRRLALPFAEMWAAVLATFRHHRPTHVPAPQVQTIGRLQQAKRAAAPTPAPSPVLTPNTSRLTPSDEVKPAPTAAPTPLSTAQRLLDVKRGRKREE
ncbi:MAG TPA: VWA domain-containing protein [Chthonomonadales bacterium]|nr:VWA domain-containing protein [Chthonomonadales bacterium]